MFLNFFMWQCETSIELLYFFFLSKFKILHYFIEPNHDKNSKSDVMQGSCAILFKKKKKNHVETYKYMFLYTPFSKSIKY